MDVPAEYAMSSTDLKPNDNIEMELKISYVDTNSGMYDSFKNTLVNLSYIFISHIYKINIIIPLSIIVYKEIHNNPYFTKYINIFPVIFSSEYN